MAVGSASDASVTKLVCGVNREHAVLLGRDDFERRLRGCRFSRQAQRHAQAQGSPAMGCFDGFLIREDALSFHNFHKRSVLRRLFLNRVGQVG